MNSMNINSQNGRLRLGILVIAIFIFWSILALTASINNPFPSLPSLWPFNQASASLATDLLDDVLDSYFSLYAIACLILGIAALLASYLMVRNLITGVCRLSGEKSSGKFLKNRAFSISNYAEIDTLEKGFKESDQYKILTTMGGPCILKLAANCGAILQLNRKGRVVFTDQEEGESFFINDRERLLALVDMSEQRIPLSTAAICGDGRRLQIKNMQVTAGFIAAEAAQAAKNGSSTKNKRICEQALREAASYSQGIQWNEFIAKNLQYELKASLMSYSSAQIQQYLDQPTGDLIQSEPHIDKHLTHANSHHGKIYPIPVGSFCKRENGIILRNRRRSLLPELRKYDPTEIQAETENTKNIDFKDELAEKITRSFNSPFHFPIVRFTIKRIGDITFDGIH